MTGSRPEKSSLYCSFCGKNLHEACKIIAGPSVFICDECVDLCGEIIAETRAQERTAIVAKTLGWEWPLPLTNGPLEGPRKVDDAASGTNKSPPLPEAE